jgi:hypothetical protein
MPVQYNGVASRISIPPAGLAISSTTNTNPITVTTSSPLSTYNVQTGDELSITDHQVNTAANGVWPVTVTGANTFTIPQAGIGVGGATGAANPITFGSTIGVIADGELLDNAHLGVAPEGNADRSAALLLRTGAYKLAVENAAIQRDDGATNVGWTITGTGAGVGNAAFSSTKIATIPHVVNGDRIELDFSSSTFGVQSGFPLLAFTVGLAFVSYAPGASPGALARIYGSSKVLTIVQTGATFSTLTVPLQLHGVLGISQLITTVGNVDVYLWGFQQVASAYTISVLQESTLCYRVWRGTVVNQ